MTPESSSNLPERPAPIKPIRFVMAIDVIDQAALHRVATAFAKQRGYEAMPKIEDTEYAVSILLDPGNGGSAYTGNLNDAGIDITETYCEYDDAPTLAVVALDEKAIAEGERLPDAENHSQAQGVRIVYELEWVSPARRPVHPERMTGRQTFADMMDAIEFMRGLAPDSSFVRLTAISKLEQDLSVVVQNVLAEGAEGRDKVPAVVRAQQPDRLTH